MLSMFSGFPCLWNSTGDFSGRVLGSLFQKMMLMNMFFRCLCVSLLLSSQLVLATDGFCLSGGYRNGYSCEVPLIAELAIDKAVFSVQLLETGDGGTLSEQVDVTHISELEDNKRLVYLGSYRTQADGLAALQDALNTYGVAHYPMLVELTPSEQMPRIRLVAEPNIRPEHLSTPSSVASIASDSDSASEVVYAIQLAVFKGPRDAQQFTQQLGIDGLLCRRKDNGLRAVYYQQFESYQQATSHLTDHAVITSLGGYVVALRNVSFNRCGAQDTQPSLLAAKPMTSGDIDTNDSGNTKHLVTAAAEMSISAASPDESLLALTQSQSKDTDIQHYKTVYSVQVAAFKKLRLANQFASQNTSIEWQCRIKDNGMLAFYYGAYDLKQHAQARINDYPVLRKQGAYVVSLRDVTFLSCADLL
jgi:hypothetical protein